jgi:predicted transcriptional regulator
MGRTTTTQKIAQTLKEARLEKGISITELASTMKTDRHTIYTLEGGKANPTIETVLKYAKAIGKKLEFSLV